MPLEYGNLNAVFIEQGIPQGERLVRLNRIAIRQMEVWKAAATAGGN